MKKTPKRIRFGIMNSFDMYSPVKIHNFFKYMCIKIIERTKSGAEICILIKQKY